MPDAETVGCNLFDQLQLVSRQNLVDVLVEIE